MRGPGNEKPTFVSLSGLTGEAAQVLQFDLYVQGFAFTNAEGAQYLIDAATTGTSKRAPPTLQQKHPGVQGVFRRALRRQVHAFADDFVQATIGRELLKRNRVQGPKGGQRRNLRRRFRRVQFREVTQDNTIVAAPCWVPGRLALYYTSYKLGHPDIFTQNLATGARSVFARYGGSNISRRFRLTEPRWP